MYPTRKTDPASSKYHALSLKSKASKTNLCLVLVRKAKRCRAFQEVVKVEENQLPRPAQSYQENTAE